MPIDREACSSEAEHPAHNRRVLGSSPSRPIAHVLSVQGVTASSLLAMLVNQKGKNVLYKVSGRLNIKIYCDCPYCAGEDYKNNESISRTVKANSPKEAISILIDEIEIEMSHQDVSVNWMEIPEVEVEEVSPDVVLRGMGSPELF